MKPADGFTVTLVASEPEVRQPILVKYDDRGRLWVIQYLQYPNPAGLKRIKVDRWSRTVYDRIPEAPPKGPRGEDRITILEDSDGDGRADKAKDFVTGLNLATGLAHGHGGVFVLQAPYLLFYPDRDRDDVPDGDPEVLLTGFGMEDAQSLANHLTWGPDGWLYGVNGSTTTCNINGVEFQQGVWRYHPLTKAFELFCEGGGNLFGLTFDARGNLFYSSNGNHLFFHAAQGGYFAKNYGKHGPLHNPYAYGVLPELHKRTPVSGGPTTGGIVYLGDSFPPQFRGAFICGDFLAHTASWWQVKPRGSTFEAARGGTLLDSRDTWFGATDCCLAPDGSVVVCDFHDRRTAHPDPDADWDRSNGRVYKIEAAGTRPVRPFDLSRLSGKELVALLKHPNGWYADQARVLLAHRRDRTLIPELRDLASQKDDPLLALQGLWALHVSGGLDEATAASLVKHTDESVRSWAVRLLGDANAASADLGRLLVTLAEADPSVVVRSQLAATARRLPPAVSLPILERLLDRKLDSADPYVPRLLWWAIEKQAVSNRAAVVRSFGPPKAWENPLRRDIALRLIRRYAAEGTKAGYGACAQLLSVAPTSRRADAAESLDAGLAERGASSGGVGQGDLFSSAAAVGKSGRPRPTTQAEPLPGNLLSWVREHWQTSPSETARLALAMRAGVGGAERHAMQKLSSASAAPQRIALLRVLAELGTADCVPTVLAAAEADGSDTVQAAALDVLRRYPGPVVTDHLLGRYAKRSSAIRSKVRDILLSHPDSTRRFLDEVDGGRIPAAEVPVEQLRRVALHKNASLDALVRKHWGNVQPGTAEERLAVMRRLSNDLRAGSGDPARGRALFAQHCGACHRLFGEGGSVGPDLTNASRADRDYLLVNLVDPSAVVRTQYLSHVLTTTGGAVHTGLVAEQDAASVTLLDGRNERRRFARREIESLVESPVSLMPDDIWKALRPQELRDLFSYLQRPAPPANPK